MVLKNEVIDIKIESYNGAHTEVRNIQKKHISAPSVTSSTHYGAVEFLSSRRTTPSFIPVLEFRVVLTF